MRQNFCHFLLLCHSTPSCLETYEKGTPDPSQSILVVKTNLPKSLIFFTFGNWIQVEGSGTTVIIKNVQVEGLNILIESQFESPFSNLCCNALQNICFCTGCSIWMNAGHYHKRICTHVWLGTQGQVFKACENSMTTRLKRIETCVRIVSRSE